VEAGKNTSTVIPASRKRRRKGNRISFRWHSVSRLKRRLMRTYFWISLFTSYRITANQLIESNAIMIANKEFKQIFILVMNLGLHRNLNLYMLYLSHYFYSVMTALDYVKFKNYLFLFFFIDLVWFRSLLRGKFLLQCCQQHYVIRQFM
jgi:hypothetical protein